MGRLTQNNSIKWPFEIVVFILAYGATLFGISTIFKSTAGGAHLFSVLLIISSFSLFRQISTERITSYFGHIDFQRKLFLVNFVFIVTVIGVATAIIASFNNAQFIAVNVMLSLFVSGCLWQSFRSKSVAADLQRGTAAIWRSLERIEQVNKLFLAYLLIGLLCLFSIFLPQTYFSGHDSEIHILWQDGFSNQFWGGDFYPRWLVESNIGTGAPTFFIYPPLAHFVTAGLAPFFPDFSVAQRIGFSIALSFAVGGTGMYLWLRSIDLKQSAAFLGGVFYITAPYLLFVGVYARSSFAEVWAFAWLPFVLLGVRRINLTWGFALLAFAVALLITTNLPAAAVFLPTCGVYLFFRTWVGDTMKSSGANCSVYALRFCASVSCGVLLSAAYLFPILTHIPFVSLEAMNVQPELLRYILFPTLDSIVLLGLVQALATILFVIVIGWLARTGVPKREMMFALFVSAIAILFQTTVFYSLWQTGGMLSAVQFPFRIMIAQTPIYALGFAVLLGKLSEKLIDHDSIIRLICVCLLITGSVVTIFLMKTPSIDSEQSLLAGDRFEPYEYRLIGDSTLIKSFFPRVSDKVLVIDGDARVAVEYWKPRNIKVIVDGSGPVAIALRQAHYPGWKAFLEDGSLLDIRPYDSDRPFVVADIPSNARAVVFKLVRSRAENIGLSISVAAFFLLVAMLMTRARLRA